MDESFDVELIKQVKKYTMLYNVNAKGYTNVEKKRRIWNAIGKRLNTTGQVCLKRWTSMRNCYKQSVERGKKSGRPPTWIYYKQMKFLEQFPNPKQSKIFASESSKQENDEMSNDSEMAESVEEEELCWRLIEEVKQRESIYNKKSPTYYDSAKRSETWKEIGRILDKSDSACRDKWRSFRDIYIKIRKRNMLEPRNRSRCWKYYEKLKFLDNHITLNKPNNIENISDGLINCDETENSLLNAIIDMDAQFLNNGCDGQHEITFNYKKKREFTKEDNMQLIKLVKAEPILYSKQCANNFNRSSKWEDIAQVLQTNVKTCKERWRALRDHYIKIKKKANDIGDNSWPYFHHLAFLNEHIGVRNAGKMLHSNAESSEESVEKEPATEVITEISYAVEPLESFEQQSENGDEMSISSNDLITYEAETLKETPGELELKQEIVQEDYVNGEQSKQQFIKQESVSVGESDEDEDEDEPILYLQSNGQDGTISSDSTLSISPSKRRKTETSLTASLKELMDKNKRQCHTCQVQQKQEKDSTTLLFESLAMSIKKSQLSDCDMLELQADIHSYIIQRLVEYNNRKKAAIIG